MADTLCIQALFLLTSLYTVQVQCIHDGGGFIEFDSWLSSDQQTDTLYPRIASGSRTRQATRRGSSKVEEFHSPASFWSPNASYTFHTCVDDDNGGTCLFSNLCIDKIKGVFVYHQHPLLSKQVDSLPAMHLRAVPTPSSPGFDQVFKSMIIPVDSPIRWRHFEHDSETDSSSASDSSLYTRRDGIFAFIQRYVHTNHAHTLGDEVWPIFQALLLFQLLDSNTSVNLQIILSDHANTATSRKQFAALSSNSPLEFATIFQHSGPTYQERNNNNVCFHKFLVGWGGLGYAQGSHVGKGYIFHQFRQHVINTLNQAHHQDNKQRPFLQDRSLPRDHVKILIVYKDIDQAEHCCTILNIDQLVSYLDSALSIAWPVASLTVTKAKWSQLDLHEQVANLIHTDIMIALPGADVLNAVFLPPQAELIVPCRYLDESTSESSNEIRQWMQRIPYLHHTQYCKHKKRNIDIKAKGIHLSAKTLTRYVKRSLVRLAQEGAIRLHSS